MYRVAVTLLALSVGTGCCSYWHNHPRTVSPTGQKLCSRHHVPLLTVRGYGTRDYGSQRYRTLTHTWGLQRRKEECNPNHIPLDQSLHRTKTCPIPILVTYCAKCEDAAWLTPEESRRVEEDLRRRGIPVKHEE